jgi:hypothetical protein
MSRTVYSYYSVRLMRSLDFRQFGRSNSRMTRRPDPARGRPELPFGAALPVWPEEGRLSTRSCVRVRAATCWVSARPRAWHGRHVHRTRDRERRRAPAPAAADPSGGDDSRACGAGSGPTRSMAATARHARQPRRRAMAGLTLRAIRGNRRRGDRRPGTVAEPRPRTAAPGREELATADGQSRAITGNQAIRYRSQDE